MMKETATYWRAPDIGDLELLKATYISHTFTRHTHAGYVIGLIERGVEAYHYRGKLHAATPGDLVVINPDEVHTGHSGDEAGWTYRTFYPSVETLRQVADGFCDKPGGMPYFRDTIIKDRSLADEIRRLHRLLETSRSIADRQFCWHDVIGRLIIRHACNRPAGQIPGGLSGIIKKAVAHIQDNIAEPISLEQLSGQAGLSPFYFSRVFRQHTGLPPHAYHKQQRVHLAKQLLGEKMPIARVAAECGFADQSHLTRNFKQIVGVTPGQYLYLS